MKDITRSLPAGPPPAGLHIPQHVTSARNNRRCLLVSHLLTQDGTWTNNMFRKRKRRRHILRHCLESKSTRCAIRSECLLIRDLLATCEEMSTRFVAKYMSRKRLGNARRCNARWSRTCWPQMQHILIWELTTIGILCCKNRQPLDDLDMYTLFNAVTMSIVSGIRKRGNARTKEAPPPVALRTPQNIRLFFRKQQLDGISPTWSPSPGLD